MNSFKHYIATALLLLALVITGCKKDEEKTPTPPTPQPQPSTTLVVKQADGTELKEGTTLAATVGATLTLTIEVPNDAYTYTATVSPTTAQQAVTVHKDGKHLTLKVNQQPTVATQLVITYQNEVIRINISISTPAPTSRLQGLYNAQGQQVLAVGYAARKANFVWLTESIAKIKSQYITISTPQSLATLAEGQTVTVASKGIDDVKLQGTFSVKVVGNTYELSNGTYTLVIVKS